MKEHVRREYDEMGHAKLPANPTLPEIVQWIRDVAVHESTPMDMLMDDGAVNINDHVIEYSRWNASRGLRYVAGQIEKRIIEKNDD